MDTLIISPLLFAGFLAFTAAFSVGLILYDRRRGAWKLSTARNTRPGARDLRR